MRLFFIIFLFICFSVNLFAVDLDSCIKCHKHTVEQSMASSKAKHHLLANRKIGSDKIDDEAFTYPDLVEYFNLSYKFSHSDGNYCVEVSDKNTNSSTKYHPSMAIGVEPLVQYVVPMQKGRFQVMSMAYEPSKKSWFNVFGDENRQPHEWGHWTSGGMNWNSNCAICHVTNYTKNFDYKTNSYKTTWQFDGITCIQCHSALPTDCNQPDMPVLEKSLTAKENMDNCAVCHSRREELTANKFKAGDNYLDYFRPALPTRGIYHPDGKVLDEDFVYSSFMMCRQYDAGLTCSDCHDPHTLKLFKPATDNSLCLTCHSVEARNIKGAPTIIPEQHSFHLDNEGNLCISCHMPKTAYMQKDFRYDHGFTSPDPFLTKYFDVPNACSQCHDKIDKDNPEKDLNWILTSFDKWYGTERFLRKRSRSSAMANAFAGDNSRELKLEFLRLLKTEDNQAWKATLISQLTPWLDNADVYEYLLSQLKSESALVRDACVGVLSLRADSAYHLQAMLDDESRLVRIDSAFALRGVIDKNSTQYAQLVEYLNFNSDRPIGALKNADFAISRGDNKKAIELANLALSMEKNEALAREVAIILFRAGDNQGALNVLKTAKKDYPNSVDISYTLALFYSEVDQMNDSLAEFENVVKIAPQYARAWYNLALSYFKLGKFESAVIAIDNAISNGGDNSMEYMRVKQYIIQNSK